MGGAFSLVGLLLTMAIIAYLWASHTSTVSQVNKEVVPEVTQMAGRDASTGQAASTSAAFDPVTQSGSITGLKVTSVVSGGAYDKYFGLKTGDVIVSESIHGTKLNVREEGDAEMSSAHVMEAFQGSETIDVIRDGKKMMLPINGGSGLPLQKSLDSLKLGQ